MAVTTIKFVGDSYFDTASGTHTAGNDFYYRSTDAADAGTLTTCGVLTSGTALGCKSLAKSASEGKIEVLSGFTWDTLTLLSHSAARVGTTTFYDNDGTAATGTIHVHGQPADADTLEIGLTGFTDTITFKTTVAGAGQVKIGATTAETADNLASYINDASTGTSTPVDGTDWNGTGTAPANANTYLSATVSGADVTLTDRIACARSLAWVTTATLSDPTDLSISTINGGIDGTLLGTIAIGSSSLSTSAASGIDLDSLTADTLPPGFTGTSKAIHTRGRFAAHIVCTTLPAAAVASKFQISPNNSDWYDVPTTTITDLGSDGDQIFNGTDLFAEYARYVITSNASGDPSETHAYITTQS